MTTQTDLFTEIKRRLWNLIGAVEITEPQAEELCRLIRTRTSGSRGKGVGGRVGTDTRPPTPFPLLPEDARDREAALAVDQRWCGPRDEG